MSKDFSSAILKVGEMWSPAPAPTAMSSPHSTLTTDLSAMELATQLWGATEVLNWALHAAKLSEVDAAAFANEVPNGTLLCSYAYDLLEISKTPVPNRSIILGDIVYKVSPASVRLLLFALSRFKVPDASQSVMQHQQQKPAASETLLLTDTV